MVALGCNIHDQMSAFIFVADSAWTARTNGQGMVSLQRCAQRTGPDDASGIPICARPAGRSSSAIAAGQRSANFSVRLRPPPPAMPMDY